MKLGSMLNFFLRTLKRWLADGWKEAKKDLVGLGESCVGLMLEVIGGGSLWMSFKGNVCEEGEFSFKKGR